MYSCTKIWKQNMRIFFPVTQHGEHKLTCDRYLLQQEFPLCYEVHMVKMKAKLNYEEAILL